MEMYKVRQTEKEKEKIVNEFVKEKKKKKKMRESNVKLLKLILPKKVILNFQLKPIRSN